MRKCTFPLAGAVSSFGGAVLIAALFLLVPKPTVFGQGENQALDVATAYDTGVRAMDNGKYDVGLNAVNDVISQFGGSGMAEFGPVFGHFYYLQGMLLIKKKDYQSAIASFKTCNEKYKNDVLMKADKDDPRLPNRFRVQSLFQWANCLMALKQWKPAAQKYEETLAQEQKYEPYIPRLQAQINLAQCYINGGQLDKGKDFLVKLIDSEGVLTDTMKRKLFMILANDWSPKVDFPQMRSIVHKYRDLMYHEAVVDRYRLRNPAFHGLAGQAIEKDDWIRALLWYSMMVHPGDVSKYYAQRIADLKGRVAAAEEQFNAAKPGEAKDRLGAYIEETKKTISELEPEIPKQKDQLAAMLLGIGAGHYTLSSLSGARSAYLELADQFPEHKQRAVILHNLVVTSVNLSLWREAYKYGMIFFDEFPKHELKPSVARVLVEVIFLQGEYQEAYDISVEVREDMQPGEEIRDIPDFVTGGSLYHLNRFEEAEFELEAYVKNYPKGQRMELIKFYLGATKVNLFKWEEAAVRLDDFLDTYPSSEMRPTALYLCGLSHLVLENYAKAYARIAELQTRFPGADEIPASWNVKGDILSGQGEKGYEEIMACYIEALRLVEEDKRGDEEVAGYSHRQMVTEATDQQDWEEAGKRFDHFKENYEQTSWRVDVNIAAIKPLAELGRKEEAKAILEGFVNEFGGKPGTSELDEMFGAYSSFMQDNYTVEEVRAAMQNFPSEIKPPPAALRAWLIMGEIEAMEATDPEAYEDDIKQGFFKLNALYESNGNNLSNYTLVRLARFNLRELGNKDAARKVYEFILNERPIGEAIGFALIDTAKMDAELDSPTNLQTALEKFERVLNEVDNPRLHEEAVLGKARVYQKQGDWDAAQGQWELYLEDSGWRLARPEANYSYAKAMDEKGNKPEALKLYVNVYANFPGHLDWSTKAYIRSAEILKERGKDLDALKVLQDMLKRMGHLEHPGVEEAKQLFTKWRAAYTPEA
ncbi:MAG: tetratricopeptide repeat protein [Verrucomicrobiales bacterium]|nr:tetratricopeptide repeat protein [Verrucomicrobiales bacterium]